MGPEALINFKFSGGSGEEGGRDAASWGPWPPPQNRIPPPLKNNKGGGVGRVLCGLGVGWEHLGGRDYAWGSRGSPLNGANYVHHSPIWGRMG